MKWLVKLLAIFMVVSGCSLEYRGGKSASLSLSVRFPSQEGLRSQYIPPYATCIEVALFRKSEAPIAVKTLTPSNPRAQFTDLPASFLYLSAVLTDGQPSPTGCQGGKVLDYINAFLHLSTGDNRVELSFPRATWSADPIPLNGLLDTSNEKVNGLEIIPQEDVFPLRSYGTYGLVIQGENIESCALYGRSCYMVVDFVNIYSKEKGTIGILGNELSEYLFEIQNRYISLRKGQGIERVLAIVSAPPCTYRNPGNLEVCISEVPSDLLPYMGLRIKGNELSGYVWEMDILNLSITPPECSLEKDFKSTITCPTDLQVPSVGLFQSPQIQTLNNIVATQELSAQQQKFNNVTVEAIKIFSYESRYYAQCKTGAPEECDYNLDGIIDSKDDTNGDGQIDGEDSRTFYMRIGWMLEFNLVAHPIRSEASKPNIDFRFHFLVSEFKIDGSNVYYNVYGIDTTSGSVYKLGTAADRKPFVSWGIRSLDRAQKSYKILYPAFLILPPAGQQRTYWELDETANLTKLKQYTNISPNYPDACNYTPVPNYYSGIPEYFEVNSGNACSTLVQHRFETDSTAYINKADINFTIFQDTAPYEIFAFPISEDPFLHLTGFIVYDPVNSSVEKCDKELSTCYSISQQLTVTSFRDIGFHHVLGKYFAIINQNQLYFYDRNTDSFTREASYTAVDSCDLREDTLYCTYYDADQSNIAIYSFNNTNNSLGLVGTISGITQAPGKVKVFPANRNVFVVVQVGGGVEIHALSQGTSSKITTFSNASATFYGTREGIIGTIMDSRGVRVCWVTEYDIQNVKCAEGAYIPDLAAVFARDHLHPDEEGYISWDYIAYTQNIPVVENCSFDSALQKCLGGNLYIYSPDLDPQKKYDFGAIPQGFYIFNYYGNSRVLLVHAMDSQDNSKFLLFNRNKTSNPIEVQLPPGGVYEIVTHQLPDPLIQ
jgi:hypothetical protein